MTDRKITFQFIVDSRFNQGENDLLQLDSQLKELLQCHDCLTLLEGPVNKVESQEQEPCVQYRKKYVIAKRGRALSWNEVYGIIHQVKPA